MSDFLLTMLRIPCLFLSFISFYLLNELFLLPGLKVRGHVLLYAFPSALVTGFLIVPIPAQYRIFINTAFYILLTFTLYKGNFGKHLLSVGLFYVIFMPAEGLSALLASVNRWDSMEFTGLLSVGFDAMASVTSILLTLVVTRVFLLIEDHISGKSWLMIGVTGAFSGLISLILLLNAYISGQAALGNNVDNWIFSAIPVLNFLCVFMPLIILGIITTIIRQINRNIEEEARARFAAEAAARELNTYTELIQRDENIRIMRHDIINSLEIINLLGQRGEFDRQMEYIQALKDRITGI